MKRFISFLLSILLVFSVATFSSAVLVGCLDDGEKIVDKNNDNDDDNGNDDDDGDGDGDNDGDNDGDGDDDGDDEEEEDTGILNMAMNISGVGYYHSRNLMFNDVMLTKNKIVTASDWKKAYTGELASDGYPAGYVRTTQFWDVNAPLILINDVYEGDYVFLYDGVGEIAFSSDIEVISTQQGKIYLKLTEPVPTETSRDPQRYVLIRSSEQGNHLRNMRLIPIEFENNESEMPLFSEDFLAGLRGMHALRFMDAQATNSSTQVHWQDRVMTTDWAFNVQGLPLEILIDLANELGADAWFCVPHRASDDYITKMAQLIKQRLDPKLKCYIEYSNEIWHDGFSQGKWIDNPSDSVEEYVKTDIANLVSPKYKSDNRHLKNAYFMARTFRLFSDVFTNADSDRLVKVATYYSWEYPLEIIQYLIDQNYRPDVMAGKAYFSFTGDDHERWNQNPSEVTKDDILDAVFAGWEDYATASAEFVSYLGEYDVPYIVYEGGQHMQPYNQKVWDYNQAVYDAQISPRMYELYIKNFELHQSLGCQLFGNFSYVSKRESQYGSWGALENLSDARRTAELMTIAPKYKAIQDASKRKKS